MRDHIEEEETDVISLLLKTLDNIYIKDIKMFHSVFRIIPLDYGLKVVRELLENH